MLVVVRGPAGSDRESLAGALAGEIGAALRLVGAETLDQPARHPAVRREARWHDAVVGLTETL